MVSWFTAFRKGFAILLWSIVWVIIGTIIVLIGGAGGLLFGGTSYIGRFIPSSFNYLVSIIFLIIGLSIGLLGTYASIVKVTADTIKKE